MQAYKLALYFSSYHKVHVFTAERKDFRSTPLNLSPNVFVTRYREAGNKFVIVIKLISFLILRSRRSFVLVSGLNFVQLVAIFRLFGFSRIGVIIHGHEILRVNGLKKSWLLFCLKLSDKVIAVSEFAKRNLIQHGIKNPVTVIPNGVDLSDEQFKIKHRKSELCIVTVGSLTRRKGQQNVIKVLPLLLQKFNRVVYHMIGVPQNKAELEQLALVLGVEHALVFHGVLSDKDKLKILEKADLFMMLSENQPDGKVEGFGIAILEANILGLPAIGSKGTGIEQAIQNGVSGILVDHSNQEEILIAVEEILNHWDKFSEGAVKWAYQHDWNIIGDRYLKELDLL